MLNFSKISHYWFYFGRHLVAAKVTKSAEFWRQFMRSGMKTFLSSLSYHSHSSSFLQYHWLSYLMYWFTSLSVIRRKISLHVWFLFVSINPSVDPVSFIWTILFSTYISIIYHSKYYCGYSYVSLNSIFTSLHAESI